VSVVVSVSAMPTAGPTLLAGRRNGERKEEGKRQGKNLKKQGAESRKSRARRIPIACKYNNKGIGQIKKSYMTDHISRREQQEEYRQREKYLDI
jgi:hypothetical protein